MDHHENKEKTQMVTQKGHKEISQDDYYYAPKRIVNEPKNRDKKEERESNQNFVDESKTRGNQQEYAWIGKSGESKQVQNISNEKENKERKKEKMERREDTNKGITDMSYEEKSKVHQENSLESKNGREKYHKKEIETMYPNGSKPVEYVSKKTEITERKKHEETESNKKHIDKQKTEKGNQQEHYLTGKSSETKQVHNIPNEKEIEEKKKKENIEGFDNIKNDRTEDTVYANKYGLEKDYKKDMREEKNIADGSKPLESVPEKAETAGKDNKNEEKTKKTQILKDSNTTDVSTNYNGNRVIKEEHTIGSQGKMIIKETDTETEKFTVVSMGEHRCHNGLSKNMPQTKPKDEKGKENEKEKKSDCSCSIM